MSVDRVAVPMEEPLDEPHDDTPPKDLQAFRDAARRHLKPQVSARTQAVIDEASRTADASKRKVNRNYRMAYCGTVTLHDAKGRALHTIRYGRMPPAPGSNAHLMHRDAHSLMQRLKEDVCALRERRSELAVVLLADGAPELWNLFSEHLNASTLGVEPMQLVDVWHALEYVAAAARLLEARGDCFPGTFRRWKSTLLETLGGVHDVLRALNATGARNARDAEGGRPVNDAIRYLENRAARMDYAGARARGLAIGSGAVEATCKSLVAIRMKRAGSRWKTDSGNEVLALRALQLSDRWQQAISGALKPLVKSVRIASAPPRRRAA